MFKPFLILFFTAAGAHALTLQDALDQALTQSPVLVEARQSLNIAQEGRNQAVADFLPQVEATGSYNVQSYELDNFVRRTGHPRSYGLNVSQNIFKGDLIPAFSAARAFQRNQLAIYENTVQQTLLNVVQAYTDVLVAEETLKQQENLLDSLVNEQRAATVRFEQGDATKTDVALADARVAGAQAQLLSVQNTLHNARRNLGVVMGQEASVADPLLWPTPLQSSLDELDILATHPLGRAAQTQLEIQRAGVTSAQGNFLPEVTANASVTRNENAINTGAGGGDNTNSQVGLNLSVPLFQGGRNVSQYREAVANRVAAEADLAQTRLELTQNLAEAQAAVSLAQAEVAAFEAEVAAAELAARGTTLEAELGDRSTLDVLDAQQDVLDAQVRLVQARASVVNTLYTLQAAQGTLVENLAE